MNEKLQGGLAKFLHRPPVPPFRCLPFLSIPFPSFRLPSTPFLFHLPPSRSSRSSFPAGTVITVERVLVPIINSPPMSKVILCVAPISSLREDKKNYDRLDHPGVKKAPYRMARQASRTFSSSGVGFLDFQRKWIMR